MLIVVVITVAVAVFAGFVYVGREQLGLVGVGLAALRTIAVGALVLLLINPGSSQRQVGGNPVVLLDASLSMAVAGGRWEAALDTAVALAGTQGTILRFGSTVDAFDYDPPHAGASRLSMALRSAVALGGPIYVVTDGELDDAGIVEPNLLENVSVVALPRDTVVDVALLNVDVPERVVSDDSIRVTFTVGTWGDGTPNTANIEVSSGGRRLATRDVELPASPGVARRELTLPPGLLSDGINLVHFRLYSPGDSVPGDDARVRMVDVTEQPAIVVLLDPPDWEGRFLASELGEVASTTVRGYAHVTLSSWLDMTTTLPVSEESVRRLARDAALLVIRGDGAEMTATNRRQPLWRWPTIFEVAPDVTPRDWYLSNSVQASPLAGRLASVQWDSVPPVLGLAQQPPADHDWVAVTARQARRGAERPVLLGRDSAGVRTLATLGTGWWRWRLRGGAAREAYRAILAGGVDWLLGAEQVRDDATLIASTVVSRDEPTLFRWLGDSIPDSLAVTTTSDGNDDVETHLLRFDSYGVALLTLPPGAFRWVASDFGATRGVVVVEEYSDEYHPRSTVDLVAGNAAGMTLFERFARDSWWLFLIVIAALTAEWAWRHRRGLP